MEYMYDKGFMVPNGSKFNFVIFHGGTIRTIILLLKKGPLYCRTCSSRLMNLMRNMRVLDISAAGTQ
jgi:hypothetical protein